MNNEKKLDDVELAREIDKALADSREKIARAVGVPFVVTIESMGYRIVPEWMLKSFLRVIHSAAGKAEAEKKDGT